MSSFVNWIPVIPFLNQHAVGKVEYGNSIILSLALQVPIMLPIYVNMFIHPLKEMP